ncbi:MAG TPA: N,N-dimethylformamidase beta subunit family domain-containing protein [Vicinamibacterales bacterium]|nr:N,N-dimethylformamidase beta subunit family domain-containing protein [Vicinamibacterales bacterium]
MRPRPLVRVSIRLLFVLTFVAMVVAGRAPFIRLVAQAPDPCSGDSINPIACENSKPGNPESEWDINGAGSTSIQGFATAISVDHGQTVHFKVDTNATAYRLDIYRIGYYGGLGARKVDSILPSASLPQNQPNCLVDGPTGLIDCGNWHESASWAVPPDAVSGVYIAKLVRTDGTAGSSHIVFVVRDDASTADFLFQTSDTTWQAYNQYGGNSLYVGGPGTSPGRAYKVSYNRPFTTRGTGPEDFFFNAEYPMIRFLEANGYAMSYASGVDTDRSPAMLLQHKIFLSVGHDEYWSGQQRANIESARAAGLSLAFFSGNEMFWKTRYESSIDGSGTPYRTLVCYKETHANAKIDPLPNVWTGTWRDPRFSPPADGGRPENAVTGTIFTVNDGAQTAIRVPASFGSQPFWRHTSIATMAPGTTAVLTDGTLGYEWDEPLDNGFEPSGVLELSRTTVDVPSKLLDYGSSYGSGTATHSLTLYRDPVGHGLVFGAGTVQWSWGLDSDHDRGNAPADIRMQQATVNLFADMGSSRPSTLQSGLVFDAGTGDVTPPVTVISQPSAGATFNAGAAVTISGTSTDTGGEVALVQVSVDGGTSWTTATGTSAWSYSWTAAGNGPLTIRVRATDDSSNVENPAASVTVTIVGSGTTGGLVAAYAFDEGAGTTTADQSGNGNTGTLANTTWTSTGKFGQALAFNGSNAWVTVQDSASLDLTTGMTLEAWVNPTVQSSWRAALLKETASGLAYALYSSNSSRPALYLNTGGSDAGLSGIASLPLNAWSHLAATYDGSTMRLYVNGTQVSSTSKTGAMRTSTNPLRIGGDAPWGEFFAGQIDEVRVYNRALQASEIQADMVTPIAPDTSAPSVTGVSPAAGATGVPVETGVTAAFSKSMLGSSIGSATFDLRDASGQAVAATVSYADATHTATLTPAASLAAGAAYPATVHGGSVAPVVTDSSGNPLPASVSWSFTTASGGSTSNCPCSIWSSATVPANPADPDSGSVELGVKFQSDRAGFIDAIRFYKGAGNDGPHVGSLWTAAGTLLGTVAFTNESATGWQEASFAAPIAIAADTVYVASYFAPSGHYAGDDSYFDTGVDNPPLHAPASGTSLNGVYAYGASSRFPSQSYRASNYWVDVVFADGGGPTPPSIVGVSPPSGATGVAASTLVTATFNESVDASTVNTNTFDLRAGSTLVPATVAYDAGSRTATLHPSTALNASTQYTATVHGGAADPRVKDTAGTPLAANVSWTFTTAAAQQAPPDDGPGGPILVISSTGNPFTRYYGEILRNEGLNLFTISDMSLVNATTLNAYDVVVLGDMPITASQTTMLTNWVNAGGNLVAMRPDPRLAGLLGLTSQSTTIADAYLSIAQSGPGAGLVSQTIQFHGTADRYSLNGASALATLYASASTATTSPAVSLRSVGSNGGQAAAFAYDLARSVVYTRQGNPDWSGEERDGQTPVRSDDLFFGAASGDRQPDWVDHTRIAIPQADEQMRLFANLIESMTRDRKPLPRFWYLPRMLKAAVVMTGDDHGNGGTAGRFDDYVDMSPAGCSVADWECIRSTSYIYPSTPLTNAQASVYANEGFEIGLHDSTDCHDFTPESLQQDYDDQLADWTAKYAGLVSPVTNRTHCITWSDYDTQPQVELAHGMRFDANYYYWPPAWVNDTPGLFTGSALPMRFAKADGTLIDVYQAATQMTDESDQTYPLTIDTLLDNALGSKGYYGVFTANMHTDTADSDGSDAIVDSALSRGVPIVSAAQMLTWLDGRNSSSFGSLTFNGTTLTFTIVPGTGSRGLEALLPTEGPNGELSSLTRSGTAVAHTVQTIKGLSYAVFPAQAGSYAAVYTPLDTTGPVVSVTAPAPGARLRGSVTVTAAATDESGTVSSVQFLLDGAALGLPDAAAPYAVTWNTGSSSNGVHVLTARAIDSASNVTTSAAVTVSVDNTAPTVSITTPGAGAAVSGTTTVTAQAADNAGVASVQFMLDGDSLGAPIASAPYTLAWITTATGNGPHTLTAIATDTAGNQTTSAAVGVTVSNTWTVPSGLVAAYTFAEGSGTTTADVSGHGNTGTITNAAWTTNGRFGHALVFNGANSLVRVADNATLRLTSAMTIEAWVNPTTLSGWRTVAFKGNTSGMAYVLYGYDNAPRPAGYINTGSGGDKAVAGTSAPALNAWTHLALTFSNGTLSIYVNGVLAGSKTYSGSIRSTTQALTMGGNDVWGEWFSGTLDEIRIYNRALTPAEIQAGMNQTLGGS